MLIYDSHTHTEKPNSVVNIDLSKKNFCVTDDLLYSIGFHPWYLSTIPTNNIKESLSSALKDLPRTVAIGETGVDKTKRFLAEQIKIFKDHLYFANENNLNVIVHSVRAQSEILSCAKKINNKSRLMFHFFNGSYEQAKELVGEGHFIGLGPQLFSSMKVLNYLKKLPVENILIETDDSSYKIDDILKEYCRITGQNQEQVLNILNKNFLSFFKIKENSY